MAVSKEREEFIEAARQVANGNPWYVADQVANQQHGVYRHNMRLRYEYVDSQIERLNIAMSDKVVVDLGCGDGQWSIRISSKYQCNLIGIDYNELRLQRYHKNVPTAEARKGSCLDIPLEDNKADIVMFHQVLEHIPKPSEALLEIYRILKPSGWLILSVPNEGTQMKKFQYDWIQPSLLKSSDHVNFYTKSSLQRQLEQNQFSVISLDSMGFHFPHQGISRRLVANRWSYMLGVQIAKRFSFLQDCLFAWCQPIKDEEYQKKCD